MTPSTHFDAAIIGGGPAGSTAAIFLARAGFNVCVIERRSFPRETLCGEFLSREVTQIVAELGLGEAMLALGPNPITTFRLFLGPGEGFVTDLGFAGFGLKRGAFDRLLLEGARSAGACLLQPATARRIIREGNTCTIVLATPSGERTITASRLVGAYGKREPALAALPHPAGRARSPFNGVKFHIPRERFRGFPAHEIQIHAGNDLYCGLNAVNDGDITLCLLERRGRRDRPPRARLSDLVCSHPGLRALTGPDVESLLQGLPVYGTSGIDFARKPLVRDGAFMVGDAARVIAPVAGDGIAVAMQSARLISAVLIEGRREGHSATAIERRYRREWNRLFHRRMVVAASVQKLLLSSTGRMIGGAALRLFPSLQPWAVRSTRG